MENSKTKKDKLEDVYDILNSTKKVGSDAFLKKIKSTHPHSNAALNILRELNSTDKKVLKTILVGEMNRTKKNMTMENNILQHRMQVAQNIEKSCTEGIEIQKARNGVYSDNAINRKLNRVGQQYGGKKQSEQESGGNGNPKGEDEPNHAEHAKKASTEALKRAAEDENADEKVRNAAKEELKKRGIEKKEEKSEEDKESERNKQRFVRDIIKNGAGKSTDDFMEENIEHYKDILDKYGAKDLFDLSQKFEEKYENDEKDPYGYERYEKIYIKCMKQIPAEKFNNQ